MVVGEGLTWHFHEGRGLQTRKSLPGPFGGHWVRSNYTFMEFFGIHVGISRIKFSEHNFKGLSRHFKSLSITSKLVDEQ